MPRTISATALTAILCLFPLAPAARAQKPATPLTPPAKSGTAPLASGATTSSADTTTTAPPPYRLAADDVISINTVNFPDLTRQVIVLPDGKISVPLLKTAITVTGMTTDEVAQLLADKWNHFVVDPSVSVSVIEKRKENVLVYGYVLRPGVTEYRPLMRVLDAIGQMGGALPYGDLRRVTLTRKTGEKAVLDLRHPDVAAGTEIDRPLIPGDVIYVPEKHNKVSVIGIVKSPGEFDFRDEMTVEEAITMAGSINYDGADLTAATLERDGKEIPLDLDALYRHGDQKQNLKLQEGDRILIPEVKNRNYVFGAVRIQGFYPYRPGFRVQDALSAGGGATPDADLGAINLIRPAADKKSATKQVVNLLKFLRPGKESGDYKYNPELQPGDVLYIPDRKHRFGSQDIWATLGGLNILRGALPLY